jgi:Holliday junction resolvase-like predicted endonuclease
MNSSSPDQAALFALAEKEVISSGMIVLDRRWRSGDHALDIVAASRGRVLVAVQVTVAGTDDGYRDFADLSEDRIQKLRAAAREWMREHGAGYEQVRIDVAGFTPYGSTFACEYIEDVG